MQGQNTGQQTILIIEDDREIADVVAMNLKDLGLDTELVRDGDTGLRKALESEYDLIILDLMLPGMDGLSVCRRIREKNPFTPVLILTAKSGEIDRVLGLEIGADDYMTKPFSVRELVARVKALLRRVHTDMEKSVENKDKGILEYNGFSIDFDKRKATLNGQVIDLTVKEFDLLALFIRNPGRTYSRNDLLKLVWRYQYQGYEHTVNSHINRLRGKIEDDPGQPRYLKTVWGIGYRFAELEEHLKNNNQASTNVEEHLKNNNQASTNVEEHLKNNNQASTNVEEHLKNNNQASTNVEECST